MRDEKLIKSNLSLIFALLQKRQGNFPHAGLNGDKSFQQDRSQSKIIYISEKIIKEAVLGHKLYKIQ